MMPAGVAQPAAPMPAWLLCHGAPVGAYLDLRVARAAGTRHVRACCPPVKTVTWRLGVARAWIAHARHTDLDHQVVPALTSPTHGRAVPPSMPTTVLAQLRPEVRRSVGRLQHTYPWHYTHEFTRIAEGLAAFAACTSLDDTAATHRARLVPSGTSGGWRLDRHHPTYTCPDRPTTHRHLVFVATCL